MDITRGTAERVAQAIEEAGENKNSISVKADITYPTLHRKLKGGTPGFTVRELGNIAQALGIQTRDLLPIEDAA